MIYKRVERKTSVMPFPVMVDTHSRHGVSLELDVEGNGDVGLVLMCSLFQSEVEHLKQMLATGADVTLTIRHSGPEIGDVNSVDIGPA